MGQSVTVSTGQQLFVDTDASNVFVQDNEFQPETLNNATGGALNYPTGTVLGRVSASGKVVPFTSGASDGSQHPMGVLNEAKQAVAAGADVVCYACVGGYVDPAGLGFQGADTLDTVISGKRVRDILVANTQIKLVPQTDLTKVDNS